jgi:hypothetical protein
MATKELSDDTDFPVQSAIVGTERIPAITVGGDLVHMTPNGIVGQFVPKSNLSATTNPGVGDDTDDGYSYNSFWFNTTTGQMFICESASAGAAVWTPTIDRPVIPSGEGVVADNVGSINSGWTSTDTVQRSFSRFYVPSIKAYSFWLYVVTGQATAAVRAGMFRQATDGGPGVVDRAVAEVALTGTGWTNILSAWTPPRPGFYWLMQHVKGINPNVSMARIGDGNPGVISASRAIMSTGGQRPRYRTYTGAYSSGDLTDYTGLTTGSIGADCPIAYMFAD